ncbi:MAG: lipid II:glycine glycyltransferase FemX [Candidatus Promineifilaceae bacterium]
MSYDALVTKAVTSAEQWQAIITKLPNPSPLQSWAWGELKSRWGWEMRPVVWELAGEPLAAAMLLWRQFPKTPFGMLYAPKGPILDYANEPLRDAVFLRLQAIARSDHAIFVKIDPDVLIATGVEPEAEQAGLELQTKLTMDGWQFSPEQIQFRNTVTLDLGQSAEQLLKQMKSKTRYNIRLAGRRDVTVRVGSPADFDAVLALYETTSERNAFAIRPKSYYLDAWRTFHKHGMLHLLIAEAEDRPIAAVLLVHNHDTCLYMYGASSNADRNRMPTHLLQWEAIQWAQQNGCRLYDFWGAPDEFVEADRMWGVWRFKRGFNGTVAHHLGAWDFPAYPRLYSLFIEALPRYREWLRNRNR